MYKGAGSTVALHDFSDDGRKCSTWGECVLPTWSGAERTAGILRKPYCPAEVQRWKLQWSQDQNEELKIHLSIA